MCESDIRKACPRPSIECHCHGNSVRVTECHGNTAARVSIDNAAMTTAKQLRAICKNLF